MWQSTNVDNFPLLPNSESNDLLHHDNKHKHACIVVMSMPAGILSQTDIEMKFSYIIWNDNG